MGNNRSGISHPALNTAGGSALWTSIDNIYQLLSDQDLGRWVSFSALANSATTTVTHGFGVSFDDLKVVVYTGTYPNLTQVQTFTAAATTGFEKTKIDVTAPASGGPFSGYVLVIHNAAMQQRVLTTAQRTALASPAKGMLVYDSDLGKVVYYDGSAWKVPADLDTAETLSNKTLAAPVFNTFSVFNQTTTPSTAAAGTVRVYAKADNKLYKMDSTGAEASIGSGAGTGGVNYLSDWYDASKPVGTVSTVAAGGNIVVSGSAPAVTSAWYADSTSGAAAIAASTSTLLRGSANYLTALSGASTSGATFVQTAAFNIDGSDLGKPVTISFDLSGVTTADDWDVVVARYTVSGTTGTFAELIPVAGTASSITGTPGAQLPTGTVQFKGFFITSATSTDVYAVRLRRRAGSTQIRVDSLTVGPQSLAQGAVVTAWQSYTPTYTGLGTVTSSEVYWRRVGNNLEVRGNFTTGTTTATEVRLSFPSGLTAVAFPSIRIAGNAIRVGSSSTFFADCVLTEPSVQYFTFGVQGSASNGLTKILGTGFASSTKETFFASVEISEWSSGTTTLADRAVEEYAFNTSTSTTASDTTSFGYGIQGALIQNITAVGGVDRTVQFTTPILLSDVIIVEILPPGATNSWVQAGKWGGVDFGFCNQNGITYGVGIFGNNNSNSQVTVRFGQYAYNTSTYGAAGIAWSTTGGNYRWRVRKVQSGAAVGFPVSARNVVGDTSGTAVPTGYVGEKITASLAGITASSPVSGTWYDDSSSTITLSPGTWRIFLSASVFGDGASGISGVQVPIVNAGLRTTGNVLIQRVLVATPSVNGVTVLGNGTIINDVSISTSTSYKFSIMWSPNSTSGSFSQIGSSGLYSYFYAVRIA